MSSPKSSKNAFSKLSLSRPKPIRILVLGQTGVGKSAMVVRYLTRRFIGEYDPFLEKIYPFATCANGDSVTLEILDSAGLSHETDSVRLESNIRWADVFLLVYSVTDKCSFDDCHRLKFLVNYNKRKKRISGLTIKECWWDVPVVLVGNKKDILEDRMVPTKEGLKRSQDIGCVAFHEISVRESIDEVCRVFTDAIRRWKDLSKNPKVRRASSDIPFTENGVVGISRCGIDLPLRMTDLTPPEGFLVEMTSRLRLGRKTSQDEEPQDLLFNEAEIEKVPYRGRASTDGWLHQRRLKSLRKDLCFRGSLLHERRMSIAMRGESTGF